MKPKTMMIDEVKYIRADSVENNKLAEKVDGLDYCIIRSYDAGVFAGYVKNTLYEKNGVNVELISSRRIYYWVGACSLSQVAMDGSKDINNCKIAMIVPRQFVANVIEIIPTTEKAKKCIEESKEWKK